MTHTRLVLASTFLTTCHRHGAVAVLLGGLLHARVVLLGGMVVFAVVYLVQKLLVVHAEHLRLQEGHIGPLVRIFALLRVLGLLLVGAVVIVVAGVHGGIGLIDRHGWVLGEKLLLCEVALARVLAERALGNESIECLLHDVWLALSFGFSGKVLSDKFE